MHIHTCLLPGLGGGPGSGADEALGADILSKPSITRLLRESNSLMVAFAFALLCQSKFSTKRWYWSGLETLGMGTVAAAIAYVTGYFIGKWVENE